MSVANGPVAHEVGYGVESCLPDTFSPAKFTMKILKILFGFLLFVLIGLVAAGFLIPKDKFIRWAVDWLEEKSGATIAYDTSHLKVFPWFTLTFGGLNAAHAEKKVVLKAATLDMSFSWLALIDRQLKVTRAELTDANFSRVTVEGKKEEYERLNVVLTNLVYREADPTTFSLSLSTLPSWAKETVALETDAAWDKGNEIVLSDAHLSLGKIRMALEGKVLEKPGYPFDFSISAPNVDLAGLNPFLAPMHPKAATSGKANVKGKVSGSADRQEGDFTIRSSNFGLVIPEKISISHDVLEVDFHAEKAQSLSIENGHLKLGDQRALFKGVVNRGETNASVDLPELNYVYLSESILALKGMPEPTGGSVHLNLFQSGKASTVTGEIKADKMQLPDQVLTNPSLAFKFAGGFLKVHDFRAGFNGGELTGEMNVKLDREPVYQIDLKAKNVEMARLPSVKGVASGRADITVRGTGKGFSKESWGKNLDASGKFNVNDLVIKGMDAFAALKKSPLWGLMKNVPGLIDVSALEKISTDARDLIGRYTIVNGMVGLPDITLRSDLGVIQLGGKIGVDKRLDFTGYLALPEKILKKIIKNESVRSYLLDGKGELKLPLSVTGIVGAPVIGLDDSQVRQRVNAAIAQMVKDKARDKIKKNINEIAKDKKPVEKVRDKIKEIFDIK